MDWLGVLKNLRGTMVVRPSGNSTMAFVLFLFPFLLYALNDVIFPSRISPRVKSFFPSACDNVWVSCSGFNILSKYCRLLNIRLANPNCLHVPVSSKICVMDFPAKVRNHAFDPGNVDEMTLSGRVDQLAADIYGVCIIQVELYELLVDYANHPASE